MTAIADLLGRSRTVSFEFFPPATPEGVEQLDRTLDELAVARPSFVSVTYGAGGSTRDRTRDLVVRINDERPYPAMPHLTCMGHARAELDALLDDYAAAGIENVLALGGDPPADGSPVTGDFEFASELVELVSSRGGFSIGVAAFPEGHPRSPDLGSDLDHLASKLAAADFGITQFFFAPEHYLRMRDGLAARGCEVPVLPGIMPLLNPEVIRRFATMNGTSFPEDLAARVTAADPGDRVAIAAEAAAELAGALLTEGVPGLHIYCLNQSATALDILSRLDLLPD